MPVFKNKGYKPNPGERSFTARDMDYGGDVPFLAKSAFFKKRRKAAKKGKIVPGFHHCRTINQRPGIGIQVGKKIWIFGWKRGKPEFSHTEEHVGEGVTRENRMYSEVGRDKKIFDSFPLELREQVLKRAEFYLRPIEEKRRRDGFSRGINAEELKERRNRIPLASEIERVKRYLEKAKTPGELEVIWDTYHVNKILKRESKDAYEKRKTELSK